MPHAPPLTMAIREHETEAFFTEARSGVQHFWDHDRWVEDILYSAGGPQLREVQCEISSVNGMLHSWLDVDRVRRPLHRMSHVFFGILVALGHGPLSSAF